MSLGVVYVYMCINMNISIHFFLQNNCERDKVKQQILCAADSTDSFHSVQDFFEQSRMKINKVNEKVTSGRKPKKKQHSYLKFLAHKHDGQVYLGFVKYK